MAYRPLRVLQTCFTESTLCTDLAPLRLQVGLQPDLFCKSGADLPDALKSEPLEDEKLRRDLQADPCVRMAVQTLRDAPALTGHL